MSARLQELKIEVAAVRRRLDEWARRLEALRARLEAGEAPRVPTAEGRGAPAVPLFKELGERPLDDVELTFEVLDTEDPGREGR